MKYTILFFTLLVPVMSHAQENTEKKCVGEIQCALSCYEQLHSALSQKMVMPGRIKGSTYISDITPYVVVPAIRGTKAAPEAGFYSFEFGSSIGTFVGFNPKDSKTIMDGGTITKEDISIVRNNRLAKVEVSISSDGMRYYTDENFEKKTPKLSNDELAKAKNSGLKYEEVSDDPVKSSLNHLLKDCVASLHPAGENSYPAKMGDRWYGLKKDQISKGIKHCQEVVTNSDVRLALEGLAKELIEKEPAQRAIRQTPSGYQRPMTTPDVLDFETGSEQ
ncbi:MAG: hypothetical protein H0V66_02885 [Bdellovibrionales bacterium]|nr:hypothetical protein [Bdellovibrionales bacterium]